MRVLRQAETFAYRFGGTQLHRGVNLDTTAPGMEKIHQILSGGNWDHPDLAGHLLDYLGQRGLGGHWTTDPTQAERFARWPNEETGRGGNLQAVVSADWNGEGADPNRTNTREFSDTGEHIRSFPWEQEHTLLPGTNLDVNGVKIRPYDDEYWNGPADPDQEIDENHEGPWHELSHSSSRMAAALGSLNVTDSAPPIDKPVMLVYGGGFNPPHQGHVASLQDAHDALAGAGYQVGGSIVAPTADKLLAKKEMDPGQRLNLQARANVSRTAFPEQMNGAPVEVATGPSEEVELAEGKPRRTDLANWAQQRYPNHTIINVTGEDATVPGAPEQHPSLYSGEVGSNHAGYNYLTLPRDEEAGMSSSKIRAAEAAGAQLPGMTPESELAYREELAKHRAGAILAARNVIRAATFCLAMPPGHALPVQMDKQRFEQLARQYFTDPNRPGISEEGQTTYYGREPVVMMSLIHRDEEGVPRGFLQYFPRGGSGGYQPGESMVQVHPEHQGKGLGTELLRQAVERYGPDSPKAEERKRVYGYEPLDLEKQRYTPQGLKLYKRLTQKTAMPLPEEAHDYPEPPFFDKLPAGEEPRKPYAPNVWFHASHHDIPEGAHILPRGGASSYDSPDSRQHGFYDTPASFGKPYEGRRDWVWLENHPTFVEGWAQNDRKPNIYLVEPHDGPYPWNQTAQAGWVANGATVKKKISDNGKVPKEYVDMYYDDLERNHKNAAAPHIGPIQTYDPDAYSELPWGHGPEREEDDWPDPDRWHDERKLERRAGIQIKETVPGAVWRAYDQEGPVDHRRDPSVGQIRVEQVENQPYLSWVGVNDTHQRRGIAKMLWEAAGHPKYVPRATTPSGAAWAKSVGAEILPGYEE